MAAEFTGLLQQFYGLAETTYDTHVATAATDAVNLISLEITPEKSYAEIMSHAGSGTYEGEIDGATGGKYTATCDVMPAAAGTAPDIGFALKAGFGTETVIGGTSVTYVSNDSAPQSLTWTKYAGTGFCERINGCSVESIVFEGAKGAIPTITIAGSFATYAYLHGNPVVNGAHATSATTINVTSGHGYLVGPGILISLGTDTNSGAGYRVTATTASTLTITPGLAGAGLSGGEAIVPTVPSQTLSGARIGGVAHDLTIDAVTIPPIVQKYTLDTGIKLMDKESSSSKPTGILRHSQPKFSFEIDAYFKHASMPAFSAAHFTSQVTRDYAGRFGANTAAARVKFNMDKALARVQAVPVSDGEATQIKFSGTARKNSAANDAYSVVWD